MKILIIFILSTRFFWSIFTFIGACIGCYYIGKWLSENYPITSVFLFISWLISIFTSPETEELLKMLADDDK